MKFKVLKESVLLEDKVVKFGGKTYPDFGWCVIMCGGPGSGKSSTLKSLVPINAKIYDVDAVKQFVVRHGEVVDNELIVNNKHFPLGDIKEPYNLKNPDYVSFLHKNLKPLTNKMRDNIYKNMAGNANSERLPNLAFDIAGSDINDFENIIFNLAPLGYKFCIVWVFNTLDRALLNNSMRDRTGNRELVIKKYGDVLTTIPYFMNRKDLIEYVNDFWMVLPVDYNPNEDKYRFVKEDNVRKININDSLAELTDDLVDMISSQQAVVNNMSVNEDFDMIDNNSRFEFIDKKIVYDYDGFTTDYTMYYDNENDEYIFIFGDSDTYSPDNTDPDWVEDSEEAAYEWFDEFTGYDESDELTEDLDNQNELTVADIKSFYNKVINGLNNLQNKYENESSKVSDIVMGTWENQLDAINELRSSLEYVVDQLFPNSTL